MRLQILLVVTALALTTAACATGPLAAPQASPQNLQTLRVAKASPVKVGPFALAPGKPASMDKSVSIRGSQMSSPNGGSFAKYLEETLVTELRAAGKLDAASNIEIRGLLTESKVDAGGVSTATAALGATFTVTRGGAVVYEKPLRVQSVWESSFLGAIAIPTAINEYTAQYSKLVTVLLNDPEFQAAIR